MQDAGYNHKNSVEYWNAIERVPISEANSVRSPYVVNYGIPSVVKGGSGNRALMDRIRRVVTTPGMQAQVIIANHMLVQRSTVGVYTGSIVVFNDTNASNYTPDDPYDAAYIASQTANEIRIGIRPTPEGPADISHVIEDIESSVSGFRAFYYGNYDTLPAMPTGTFTFSGGVEPTSQQAGEARIDVKRTGTYHIVVHCIVEQGRGSDKNALYIEVVTAPTDDETSYRIIARSPVLFSRHTEKMPLVLSQAVPLLDTDRLDIRIRNAISDTQEFSIFNESYMELTLIEAVPSGANVPYFSNIKREISEIE